MTNAIIGQSGGPTSVINSSLAGAYEGAKKIGCDVVFGMRNGIQGFLDDHYVDLSEYLKTEEDIRVLKQTPSSFLGSCRFKLPEPTLGNEVFEAIFKKLKEMDIRYFFYIGGNDSMDTTVKLQKYAELKGEKDIIFFGIPKTIDNDLAVTDHTPGFGSAAKYVATITKEIILDAGVYGKPIVTVIEVMGRNAGWLTAATTLAKCSDSNGVDFIYLPEIPFDMDACMNDISKRIKYDPSVVIAVSEGAVDKNGESISAAVAGDTKLDAFGHKALTGTGRAIADFAGNALGCKTRTIELASLQRCGSHIGSKTDVEEAYNAGFKAAEAAAEGKTGHMVYFKRASQSPYICDYGICHASEIANVEKKVPREWINKEGNQMLPEFEAYARPLIQGELDLIMENGLPKHIKLPNIR